jgi:hypothetical protein
MAFQVRGGKFLLVGGKFATNPDCCCDEESPCNCPCCDTSFTVATITISGVTACDCVKASGYGGDPLWCTADWDINGTYEMPISGSICGETWRLNRAAPISYYWDSGCTDLYFTYQNDNELFRFDVVGGPSNFTLFLRIVSTGPASVSHPIVWEASASLSYEDCGPFNMLGSDCREISTGVKAILMYGGSADVTLS